MNNSLTTFLLINSILIIGLITIQNESKDNKKSALEFFSSPDFQNLMGLIQNNMFGLEDIVGKQKKLTRDLEKQYLNFDSYLDEFFAMTAEYGLKKKDKK